MPVNIVRGDITKLHVDAIVNAANTSLLGGGGVDGSIHRAAGKQLLEACRKLHGCHTGEAKITEGFLLPARYVIHTVGPVYQDGRHDEEKLLRSCYHNSLLLAEQYHCHSVAFPLISAGVYGYPKEEALRIAMDEMTAFDKDHEIELTLVIFDLSAFMIDRKLQADIAFYIDEAVRDEMPEMIKYCEVSAYEMCAPKSISLEDALLQIDESFSEMLLRKIDEEGMKDSECYKKANVDRKLFSKIRSNKDYKPSKMTALAFAIALELSLDETDELLEKAGYALSHSSKADIIIAYFIVHGNYNIYEINEALFAFDQPLLA